MQKEPAGAQPSQVPVAPGVQDRAGEAQPAPRSLSWGERYVDQLLGENKDSA